MALPTPNLGGLAASGAGGLVGPVVVGAGVVFGGLWLLNKLKVGDAIGGIGKAFGRITGESEGVEVAADLPPEAFPQGIIFHDVRAFVVDPPVGGTTFRPLFSRLYPVTVEIENPNDQPRSVQVDIRATYEHVDYVSLAKRLFRPVELVVEQIKNGSLEDSIISVFNERRHPLGRQTVEGRGVKRLQVQLDSGNRNQGLFETFVSRVSAEVLVNNKRQSLSTWFVE